MQKTDKFAPKDANQAVEWTLTFERNWASFDAPRYLMALDSIQKHVCIAKGLSPGDYSFYASNVETLFQGETYPVLDELGIPFATTEKCTFLKKSKTLNETLASQRKQNIAALNLEIFEKEILLSIQKW